MSKPKFLNVSSKVRYPEDSMLNGISDINGNMPGFSGKCWNLTIDIYSGKVLNWPANTTADIYYKVCDLGYYEIVDEDYNVLSSIDGYVPQIMCPNGGSGGDYIDMTINEFGEIKNWVIDFSDFDGLDDL